MLDRNRGSAGVHDPDELSHSHLPEGHKGSQLVRPSSCLAACAAQVDTKAAKSLLGLLAMAFPLCNQQTACWRLHANIQHQTETGGAAHQHTSRLSTQGVLPTSTPAICQLRGNSGGAAHKHTSRPLNLPPWTPAPRTRVAVRP